MAADRPLPFVSGVQSVKKKKKNNIFHFFLMIFFLPFDDAIENEQPTIKAECDGS